MDNYSDNSDVDIDEVDKMVEDLEDLDNNLFGDTLPRKNLFPIKKGQQNPRETTKKVAFEDFDDDNSLNDLLTDSNESQQNTKPLNSRGSKIADLFGTKTENATDNKIAPTFAETNSVYSTTALITQKPISNVESDLNIPIKVIETTKLPTKSKKSTLMEDLFGTKTRASSLKNIYDTPMEQNFGAEESVSTSMPNLLKNEQITKPMSATNSAFMLSSTTVKEPRRGRPKSTVTDDPLGLLTTSKLSQEKVQMEIFPDNSARQANKTRNQSPPDNLPEWLGGTKKSNQAPEQRVNVSAVQPNVQTQRDESIADEKNIKDLFLFPDISRLTDTQFGQQTAIITMQQQEHELRTAAILTQQTDQLNNIVESQKNKISEQEKLFDNLVKQQVNRQAMLESQIKLQQARIDNFIQTIVKQPMMLSSALHTENKDLDNTETENTKIQTECLLNTLEVEKNNLEQLIEILKDKHKQEINILNDSHDMQMRFMQETMDKLETKLRREIEELEKVYEKKIEKLLNEREQQEIYFREQINNLKTDQAQIIKDNHNRNSEQAALNQKEYAGTIENIYRAIEMERQAVDFIKLHKTELDNIMERSQLIYDGFQTTSDQLKNDNAQITDKREKYLTKREENLQALIEQINIQQKTLDNERQQLIITAQKFETETSKLTRQLEKNSELFNEREERLGMQEKALMRERELLQEQNKWERDHLQCLKEAWMADQKQQIQLLANDRQAVAAEKAKLEVLNSLKTNSDDISKVELEAALKTAHNSAHEANLERQRWQERANKLQADQHRIELKEKQLMEKAKDLEDLTQSALMKQTEGLRALKDAHRLEKQHKDQTGQLHLQLEALAERENKIAMEKITLARERLALRVSQIDKPEKDVTNDSLRNKINDTIYNTPVQLQTHFKDIVDPQLLLLKLSLDNRLDTSNQLLTDLQTIG